LSVAASQDRLRGEALLDALERGEVRAAEPPETPGGTWRVPAWVKAELLSIFAASPLVDGSDPALAAPGFLDKRAFPLRRFSLEDGVRLVPGGSAVRRGAHLGKGVVCMPPMYVNAGAFVGEGTMIDSHALVGSCAQVGARVHVSAACQLGGVLEPVGARPVIVEDDCLIGASSALLEGVLVRSHAVIGAGTVLTASTRVYDLVRECELERREGSPLEIPRGAVVVPGSRPARGAYAREHGLQVPCALIVKYRDERTDRAASLEDALR
jgi:2,3,4,5-tetrahydropyridine-2-carboxylate N-succinyltransferase